MCKDLSDEVLPQSSSLSPVAKIGISCVWMRSARLRLISIIFRWKDFCHCW